VLHGTVCSYAGRAAAQRAAGKAGGGGRMQKAGVPTFAPAGQEWTGTPTSTLTPTPTQQYMDGLTASLTLTGEHFVVGKGRYNDRRSVSLRAQERLKFEHGTTHMTTGHAAAA